MRDLTVLMRQTKRLDEWWRTSQLMDFIAESNVALPGMKEDDVLLDPSVKSRVLQSLGRKLSIAFRQSDELEIDGMVVRKRVESDYRSQEHKEYRFEDGTTTPF